MAGQLQVAFEPYRRSGCSCWGPFGCAETPGSGLMPAAARNVQRRHAFLWVPSERSIAGFSLKKVLQKPA